MRAPIRFDVPAHGSVRLVKLVHEIHARLAPVCTETPIDVFDEMVLRIARVQLRYELKPSLTSTAFMTGHGSDLA